MTLHFNHHPGWCSCDIQSVGSPVQVVSRWLWPWNRTFWEVDSMVVIWWILLFVCSVCHKYPLAPKIIICFLVGLIILPRVSTPSSLPPAQTHPLRAPSQILTWKTIANNSAKNIPLVPIIIACLKVILSLPWIKSNCSLLGISTQTFILISYNAAKSLIALLELRREQKYNSYWLKALCDCTHVS